MTTMRPDLLLRLLAEASGETLWAIDMERIAHEARSGPQADAPTTVAVLPLYGVLSPNGIRFMGRQYGPGLNTFRDALAAAASNPEVGAIVLDIDSPGGPVSGVAETAAAVKAAAQVKPVVAMADSICASAAYWIASQAGQFWMSPSAMVGSIGVMGTHMDYSEALAAEGIKPTTIVSRSAPYKNELSSHRPLSEAAATNLQSLADSQEDDFIATIAQGRKTTQDAVRSDFGQGRMLLARAAVNAGMVDKIGSMSDVLASLRTKAGGVRRRMSALAFA
jgi:signal peptide peptidase SppA